jgi:sulfur-oxidizing protein SoxA
MSYVIKFFFALILFSSLDLVAEEKSNYKNSEKPYKKSELKSGSYFSREETRAIELDDFENPGMIWVERGSELFNTHMGNNSIACSNCHNKNNNSLIGVATTYPKIYKNKLINLEQKINICLDNNMNAEPYLLESNNLLSLSSFITYISRGMPMNVSIKAEAQKYFNRGKEIYFERVGQMNLACNQCHDNLAGNYLRAEKISQGHINGFPSYLMRWENIASVHRRFQFCNNQARAEPLKIGHDDYNALQLYIAWRGNGLLLESPSVRR